MKAQALLGRLIGASLVFGCSVIILLGLIALIALTIRALVSVIA